METENNVLPVSEATSDLVEAAGLIICCPVNKQQMYFFQYFTPLADTATQTKDTV